MDGTVQFDSGGLRLSHLCVVGNVEFPYCLYDKNQISYYYLCTKSKTKHIRSSVLSKGIV